MDAETPAPPPAPGRRSLVPNVIGSWATIALSVVVTLVITPFVIRHLQHELYGVWSFLNGLMVYSDLLYAGLGAALIRHVAASAAREDHASLNRVSSVVLSIYGAIGLLCLLVFALLGPLVPHLFAQPLPADAQRATTLACVLLGVQLLGSFVGSAFTGVLFGLDRNDLISLMRVGMMITRAAAILLLLPSSPSPLIGLAAITATFAVAEAAGYACLAFRIDRRLLLRPALPTRAELKDLYSFGLQSFFVLMALTLIAYTDTTVIGVMLGASFVAWYALPLQLLEYVRIAATATCGVLLPRLTVLAENGDTAGLQEAYARAMRITMAFASFCLANVLFLGAPFLSIWVGAEFGQQARPIIGLLAAATWVHILAVTVPMAFCQARKTLAVPARMLMIEAVANLVLSVALAPWLGIAGVAVGTLVPAVFVGGVVLPRHLYRDLGLDWRAPARALVPSAIMLALVSLTLWILGHLVADTSYVVLAFKASTTAVPAVVIVMAFFPDAERQWIIESSTRAAALPARAVAALRARR